MIAEVTAPAKIILFGEHAVVYNQPAIAIPLSDIRASATIEHNSQPDIGLRIVAEDLNQVVDVAQAGIDNTLAHMARHVLQQFKFEPPDVTIRLRSAIPVASGLGSGAAIAAVLGRALCAAVRFPVTMEQLNDLVYEIEKLHHGTPSGIDNTVVVYEQPVYFVRGQPIQRLTIKAPFQLLVADTGQRALTKVAVGDVRKLYERDPDHIQPILDQIGAIVQQARQHIETGMVMHLGALMTQNHALLQDLTVSSTELDRLVTTALDAGALGAKLSGAGRGGNMIAFITPHTLEGVKSALLKAGAVSVLETTVMPGT